jgi:anti-sigma factor RsiW
VFADCNDVLENAEAYVIGVLDDDEAVALTRHLEGCDACQRSVEQAAEMSHALALAVPLATPDASVKARVMAGALALGARGGQPGLDGTRPWPRR